MVEAVQYIGWKNTDWINTTDNVAEYSKHLFAKPVFHKGSNSSQVKIQGDKITFPTLPK